MLSICNCCKCGEHQLGKQVCRIGAQQYHIQSYAEKYPEEFKENAKKYETMNREGNQKGMRQQSIINKH